MLITSGAPRSSKKERHRQAVNRMCTRERNRRTPVYTYPDNVMTSSAVALFSKYGIEYREDIGVFTRAMDAQREAGKTIFGAGYIVPEEAARKTQEAVRKAQKEKAWRWELSARELAALKAAEEAAKQ